MTGDALKAKILSNSSEEGIGELDKDTVLSQVDVASLSHQARLMKRPGTSWL